MLGNYLYIDWNLPFSSRTKVFPAILILQMLSSFINSNFVQKFVLARGARAQNYEPLKNEHIFRALQNVAATIKNFNRNLKNGHRKKFGLTEIFVKYF